MLTREEDWEEIKKRWEADWAHDLYDRVLLQITAPRADADSQEGPFLSDEGVEPETKWADFDHMIRRELKRIRTTYYGGEALPVFAVGWSVGWSLLFGCTPIFHPGTVWVEPIPVGDDGYPELRFSPENS